MKTYSQQDITEKAEAYVTMSVSERQEFLKLIPEEYKNRMLAQVFKINQNPNPTPTPKVMAKILNKDETMKASFAISEAPEAKREEMLNAIHGASRPNVKKGLEAILENRSKQTKTETKTEIPTQKPKPTVMADAAAKTRGANTVLDPKNLAHKIVLIGNQLKVIAKSADYKGFDPKNLKAKAQGGDEAAKQAAYARRFETFRRKFILEEGETVKEKPLSSPANPLHEKALEIGKEMAKAYAEDAQDVADNAEKWLDRLELVYKTEQKGGTGRAAVKIDLKNAPKDLFSFLD